MKKRRIIIVCLLCVLAVAAYPLGRRVLSKSTTLAVEIKTATVEYRDMGASILASGAVRPDRGALAVLTARTSGRIDEIHVIAGSSVAAGDLLVTLEADSLIFRVDKARLALRSAELQLEQVKSGSRPEEIERARINLGIAEKKLDEAAHRIAVLEENEADGNAQQLEAAQKEYENAQAQVLLALQQLSLVENKYTAGDIEQAQLKVKQAANDLAEALAQLEAVRVTAPINGIVAAVHTYRGESVSNGGKLVTLLDYDNLVIEAMIDESEIGKIRLGQQVTCKIDGLGADTLEGMVTGISPLAKIESGIVYYPVIISLESPSETLLLPEMSADITVYLEERQAVLSVPVQAVRQGDSGQVVFVEKNGQLYEIAISVGRRAGGYLEITSGLKAGERVVTGDLPAAYLK
ncbi:MAG: efflux RND transporter periplasmic adaptor subunit [Dethiobacter sp.]|jgi:RND family efflux transporter MFP subunit|nr:efflux RND transporter periplasmic adaptor subunit [Dethiobacter sp.]